MLTCDDMKVYVYHKVHRVCYEYTETHLPIFLSILPSSLFQSPPSHTCSCLLPHVSLPAMCNYSGFQCNFGSQMSLSGAPLSHQEAVLA